MKHINCLSAAALALLLLPATTFAKVQDFASTQVTKITITGYFPHLDDLTASLTPAPIPTSTWNVNSAGDWNTAGNWDNPGQTKVALGAAITASQAGLATLVGIIRSSA